MSFFLSVFVNFYEFLVCKCAFTSCSINCPSFAHAAEASQHDDDDDDDDDDGDDDVDDDGEGGHGA